MNKLARYLNQHLLGEVSTTADVRARHATDNSLLEITPEMVAFPRETSDIRKLVSFADQLATKGHTLGLTPRGAGTDTTGGAIGNGIAISMPTHMNRIFEYEPKQRLVRLQPGVKIGALREALRLHGTAIPALEYASKEATVGGVIAGDFGTNESLWAEQLVVVLSNGDAIQTKRLSKRELTKKKAGSGLEGKIYRELDELLQTHADVIREQAETLHAGYRGLADVRRKDGSFDLTPLVYGSQGTLGIVSELIARAEYVSDASVFAVAAFTSTEEARDALDGLEKLGVDDVRYYDKTLVALAEVQGKSFPLITSLRESASLAAVLTVKIDDMNSRTRMKKLKKFLKHMQKRNAQTVSTNNYDESELRSYDSIGLLALQPTSADGRLAPIIDGAHVPLARIEAFLSGVAELAKKYSIEFGVYGQPLIEQWSVRAELPVDRMSGRQTSLRLIAEFASLVEQSGGSVVGQWAEGRTLAPSAHQATDDRLIEVYAAVKTLFDPLSILNPGVKQAGELKDLVRQLRSGYQTSEPDGLARF